MPIPGKSSSPKFKGKESKLLEFLQDYEAAASTASLSDEQKCCQVTRYTSKAIKDLWEQLPAFLSDSWNWSTYKAQILEQYPGIDQEHKHTYATLNIWATRAHRKKIANLTQYGSHKRSFLRRAAWLATQGQLEPLQKGIVFSKSLPKKLRKKAVSRLQMIYPAHHPKEPYSYEQLDGAATFVLRLQAGAMDFHDDDSSTDSDSSSSDSDSSDSSSGDESDSEESDSDEEDRRRRRKKEKKKKHHGSKSKSRGYAKGKHVSVKKEDKDTLKNLVVQMNQGHEQNMKMMEKLAVALTQQATVSSNTRYGPPASGSNAVPIGNRPFPRSCAFCGENGHFIRECKHREEYVTQGKVMYTNQGRLAMKNGEPIPFGAQGQTMKQRVDGALQQNSSNATYFVGPQTSPTDLASYLYEITPEPVESMAIVEDATSDEEGDEIEVMREFVTSLQTGDSKGRTNPAVKPKATQSQPQSQPHPATSKAKEGNTNAPAPHAPPRRMPFTMTPETSLMLDETIDLIMKSSLTGITASHMVALSPLVRARLSAASRSQYTQQQQPRANVEVNLTSTAPRHTTGIVVSQKSVPLREVEAVINDKLLERAVLDDGSQIILIREDLWVELENCPLNKREQIDMEVATGCTTKTLGLVENLAVRIAGITFYLQVHVVEHAPFRFLLGRPFSSLAKCIRDDSWDGTSSLTITDPNDVNCVKTIPTLVRRHPQSQHLDSFHIGVMPTFKTNGTARQAPAALKRLTSAWESTASKLGKIFQKPTKSRGQSHQPLQEQTHKQLYQENPPVKIEDSANENTTEVFVQKKYKPVARRVKPVATTLPEEFRVVRNRVGDPLENMKPLPRVVPDFIPGKRLTKERWEAIRQEHHKNGFLLEEEINLLGWVLKEHENALAWDESMRGTMREDMFPPVVNPVIPHIPWVETNYPIPAGIRDEVCEIIKTKIEAGTYEPSSSSYRSRWFTVLKKNGKLRIVHNLEPLNQVTIKNSGVPPVIEEVIEESAGRGIYSLIDILVGYDHRTLAPQSRDATTFQSPLGPLRLTRLPMGATNSVAIFHGDITFVLEEEIPEKARVFIDDILIKGLKTRYEIGPNQYETITMNVHIRRFVYEHLQDLHLILQRLEHARITISAKKLIVGVPEVTMLGNCITYEGRIPDESHVKKIKDWPPCQDLTQARGFLGVTGLVRMFIKDYALIAHPLTKLTRKSQDFEWGVDQVEAFSRLKEIITTYPVLRTIDYRSGRTVILSVDSSVYAVGWVLYQLDEDSKRHPVRYDSKTWSSVESRYSQAKLELLGLLVALKNSRAYIIGLKNLKVEIDAQYIKGMLNNPDQQPNATINRWIAAIKLFEFELVHVPKDKHKAPDGLSRRMPTKEEQEEIGKENIEDWINDALDLYIIEQANSLPIESYVVNTRARNYEEELQQNAVDPNSDSDSDVEPAMTHNTGVMRLADKLPNQQEPLKEEERNIPSNKKWFPMEQLLQQVKVFLETMELPEDKDLHSRIIKSSSQHFVTAGILYRRRFNGRHQVIPTIEKRYKLLEETHDRLGHGGFYPTRQVMLDRFWWPSIIDDIKWYIRTCNVCQQRQMLKLHLPPTVQVPPTLFKRCHVDTMFMPKSRGLRYIIQGIDALSGWPEWRALKKENGESVGKFIFENILCRFGAIEEIISDNGPAMIKGIEWLAKKYHIQHIRISPYNSQAQGVVERAHLTAREAILKMCKGSEKNWPIAAPYAFWAIRVTTKKATGHSPYYMTHGCEPLLPFDLAEATYLAPALAHTMTTADLLAARARQLEKREEDIEMMRQRVYKARKQSAKEFSKKFRNTIHEFNFLPGKLVLVRNSAAEGGLVNKYFPRYLGPYVVIRQSQGGAYTLAEMDGTISNLKFAAKRVVPYYLRTTLNIPSANKSINEANDIQGHQK